MNIIEMHSQGWKQLQERRAQLPHALLIAGQRGIGKFELARSFAAALLCEDAQRVGKRLRSLPSLRLAGARQSPGPAPRAAGCARPKARRSEAAAGEEVGRKKASQQITIDQVRALDEFLHVGTHRHGARVVLLNPAEAMNRATANAILKSLEEPIAGTLFILISSEPHRLLPTIRSRCQTVPMRPPPAANAVAWLRHAGVGDGEQWLALAGGSPLLALELSVKGERALLDSLLGQMLRGKGLDAVAAAAAVDKAVKAEKRPAPLKRSLEWAQKWLFDLTLGSQGLPPRYFVAHAPQLLRLAQDTDTRKLLAFNGKAIQYKAQCEQPVNSRLFLEEFFLNYARLF
jgi:DNA polymerase-3 subunit delta'